jgi:hypothetical protein
VIVERGPVAIEGTVVIGEQTEVGIGIAAAEAGSILAVFSTMTAMVMETAVGYIGEQCAAAALIGGNAFKTA